MADNKKFQFEKAFERIEEIVAILEKGTASLDESLKLYEEGIGLIRKCSEIIGKARQFVTKVETDGETLIPFESDPDNSRK